MKTKTVLVWLMASGLIFGGTFFFIVETGIEKALAFGFTFLCFYCGCRVVFEDIEIEGEAESEKTK